MREGTQFEFEAKKRAEEQRKSLPSPGSQLQPQEGGGDRGHVAGDLQFCVFSVSFSSDSREILGGADDGCLYVYDR